MDYPIYYVAHRSDSLEALSHFVFVRAHQSENLEAEQRVLFLCMEAQGEKNLDQLRVSKALQEDQANDYRLVHTAAGFVLPVN